MLGDTDYRDTGCRSHCNCCTMGCHSLRYSRYVLLYLSLIAPLGTVLTGAKNSAPKGDESTMTLAPLLQHFTRTLQRFWGPGTECALRVYPSLKIDFIFLAFQCNHRVVHLVDSSYSRHAAYSVPSDPNRNDPPYKGRMYARLPALLRAASIFQCVSFIRLFYFLFYPFPSFLPLPPIRLAQTDSANMAVPKAQVSGDSLIVLWLGRLSLDNNLGLLAHAFAGLSPWDFLSSFRQ
ncbi:hypothetical protein B0H13DRAFT_2343165 [Mycena leptocephala]|nr:hypothetical protein B0H13DRAFT_2343165 [Mycena leptocephala]